VRPQWLCDRASQRWPLRRAGHHREPAAVSGRTQDERNPVLHRSCGSLPGLAGGISMAIEDRDFFGRGYWRSSFAEITSARPRGQTTHRAGPQGCGASSLQQLAGKVARGPCKPANHTWGCATADKPPPLTVDQQTVHVRSSLRALRFLLTRPTFGIESGRLLRGACTWAWPTGLGRQGGSLQVRLAEEPQPGSSNAKPSSTCLFGAGGNRFTLRQLDGGRPADSKRLAGSMQSSGLACSDACLSLHLFALSAKRFNRLAESKRRASSSSRPS